MNVLALNAGSGTLRYKLLAMPHAGRREADESVEAAERAVDECLPLGIDAIGYRVVHGGSRFDGPTRITPDVLEAIRALSDLAPLHNPIDLAVIEAGSRRAPGGPCRRGGDAPSGSPRRCRR